MSRLARGGHFLVHLFDRGRADHQRDPRRRADAGEGRDADRTRRIGTGEEGTQTLPSGHHAEVVDGRGGRRRGEAGNRDDGVDRAAGFRLDFLDHPLAVLRRGQVDQHVGIAEFSTDFDLRARLVFANTNSLPTSAHVEFPVALRLAERTAGCRQAAKRRALRLHQQLEVGRHLVGPSRSRFPRRAAEYLENAGTVEKVALRRRRCHRWTAAQDRGYGTGDQSSAASAGTTEPSLFAQGS